MPDHFAKLWVICALQKKLMSFYNLTSTEVSSNHKLYVVIHSFFGMFFKCPFWYFTARFFKVLINMRFSCLVAATRQCSLVNYFEFYRIQLLPQAVCRAVISSFASVQAAKGGFYLLKMAQDDPFWPQKGVSVRLRSGSVYNCPVPWSSWLFGKNIYGVHQLRLNLFRPRKPFVISPPFFFLQFSTLCTYKPFRDGYFLVKWTSCSQTLLQRGTVD